MNMIEKHIKNLLKIAPKWTQNGSKWHLGTLSGSTLVNGTLIPSLGENICDSFRSPIGSLRVHKIAKSQNMMLSDTLFLRL